MKRVLTKISGILNTILFGLLAAGCSLIFGLILSGSTLLVKLNLFLFSNFFTAVLVLIIFIIAIVGLVFSIKAISYSRFSIEEYRNKYPILIANTVFNSMFSVLLIFIVKSPSLLDVLILGCLIACGILYVIDMARNTNMLESLEKVKLEGSFSDEDDGSTAESLESQLKKLNELKEQNLITEKELLALREKLVKQEIEKE